MSDEDVSLKFGSQIEGALSGINSLKDHIEGIGGSLNKITGAFKELGEAAIAAFAVEKAGEFFEQFANKATQIERLSIEFGLLSDQVQGLQFALKAGGGSEDALQSIFTRMDVAIQKAIESAGDQRKAFADLGVSTKFLADNSGNLWTVLLAEADGINKLGASSRTVHDAVLTMGRGMSELFPTLAEGSAHLLELKQRLEETGAEMSDKQIKAFHETHESLLVLSSAFQGLKLEIADALLPAFDTLVAYFTHLIEGVTIVIKFMRELQVVMGADLVIACGFFVKAMQDLGTQVSFVAEKIIIKWKELGAILTAIATGQWSLISDITKEADEQVATAAKNAVKAIGEHEKAFNKLKTAAEKAAAATLAAERAGAGGKKGAGGDGGKPSAGALDDISTQESIAKAHLATSIAILQQEQVFHQITKQQEVEEEKHAVDQEYAIVRDAMQKKAALYRQNTDEHHKALNQMAIAEAQHTAKIAQLDVKMAQANKQAAQQSFTAWKGALQPIETAFDGMLSGILSGTETLSQAMSSAFSNMAISVVESILKIIAEWLLFELVTEGQGSWDDFVSIQGGGSDGPLGSFGKILGFAEGTDYVPKTGLALIHQGEMVIPSSAAQALREGGSLGGGGVSAEFHIHAIDTQSGAQFLRDNMGVITQGFVREMRNQNGQLNKAMKSS